MLMYFLCEINSSQLYFYLKWMSDYVSLLILNSSAHFTMTSISTITTNSTPKRPKKLHNYVIMCFSSFWQPVLGYLVSPSEKLGSFLVIQFYRGQIFSNIQAVLFLIDLNQEEGYPFHRPVLDFEAEFSTLNHPTVSFCLHLIHIPTE